MADKSIYAPDEESQRKYQEALDRVTASLDARKNRLFDPTLLAMAEGFLAPTRTGSFGESLGLAAGKLRGAEEAKFKEEQELAQAQLGLAQQGMQLQQQRARQQFLAGLGGPQGGAGAPPQAGGAPSQGPVPPGAQAAIADKPPGTEGITGEQFMPPNPQIADRVSYLRAAALDPKKSPTDIIKELQDLESKRFITTPEGQVDLAKGLIYRTKKPDITPVQIQLRTIPGVQGQSLTVSTPQAREHDAALKEAMEGKPERLRMLERNLVSTFADQGPTVGQPSQGGAPGAPTGLGRIETSEEQAATAAAQKATAEARAKAATDKEAQAQQQLAAAKTMLFNSNRVQQLVSQNPQAFGIFSRPGLASAFGNLINEGIRAGTTNVQLGGFEKSVLQMMPKIGQKELDAVSQAAGALAEMELAFTILYMQKQGAITEGEREIVRRIGGNTSQSPQALLSKARMIGLRSQHDINVGEAWNQFQDQNPRANYNDFMRSKPYRDLLANFDQKIATEFGVKPPGQSPASTGQQPKFIIRPAGGQ